METEHSALVRERMGKSGVGRGYEARASGAGQPNREA